MKLSSNRLLAIISTFVCFSVSAISPVHASEQLGKNTYTPEAGVICDTFACANGTNGLSAVLTAKYVGKAEAEKVQLWTKDTDVTLTEFTFEDGAYCDVKARLCYVDRYFDAAGKHSKVDTKHTDVLFPPQ